MKHEEWTLDPRTQEDLCDRMEELAASYTPEWRFDRRDPDIGSTLALIFAGQMADNIRRLNQLPEKYHTEFADLLGMTLKPAYPASGVAVAEVMRGTAPGVALPRGTRLMAEGAEGEPILFETAGDVYLTNARITDILSLSGTKGRVIPLLGGPRPAELLPGNTAGPVENAAAEPAETAEEKTETTVPAFAIFDYEEPGIEKNALLLYHRDLLGGAETVPVQLAVTTPEGAPLAETLTDPARWRWSYYDGTALCPFVHVEVQEGVIVLRRERGSVPVKLDGTDYHMICLEALEPPEAAITVGDIRMASRGGPSAPELILHEGEVLEAEECLPFGSTVSLFDECYFCDDQVFSQQGADVTLSFHLETRRKLMRLTAQQEREELRVIKRKPRAVQYDTAHAAPERIAMEYFNGQAWRKLPCSAEWSTLMDGTRTGDYQITFQCPEDWAAVPVNGYSGRSLRLRVMQADDCYLLPCEHTMPVLQNVRLSYQYNGVWKQPQRVRTVRGTVTEEATHALLCGEPVTVFAPLPYPAASLYLGFDRPIEGAPVSILFDVEETVSFHMEPLQYEYSTRSGFRPVKVIDRMGDLSGSGTVLFMPPADFAPVEVEGVRRWWLRLRGSEEAVHRYHPRIRDIRLNAVDIRNQQTQEEETFYPETSAPNMAFPLAARNILSAEVFVSELGQHSRQQMRQMQALHPQEVRLETNAAGEITAFSVRWTEVDTFDRSRPGDRHYMIDRMRNLLVFGDGVHVRIPQAGRDAAISVRAVSCDGSRGNVPAGAVDRFFGNVMYVESVRNPVATYAGSDLETVENACRRGADLLSSRGRLVSERDFVRAVRAFSGSVAKVKCVAGRTIDGRVDPAVVSVAVMTQDYNGGAYAFNNIREPLRRHLLERCGATLDPACLMLSEPIYVEITVSVWAKVANAAKAFAVQNLILESIRDFLDPISRPGHSGWEIGTLPTEGQIKMLLHSLRFEGHIGRMIAVARYVDHAGPHETELDAFPNMPFAIGVGGTHQIHLEFQ